MRAKRPVEMRQIVESPPVDDFGNVQEPLIRIAQRYGARFKAALQHPAAECLADLGEARMQRPQRDADMIGRVLRREIRWRKQQRRASWP
jgi:hypothetical protein